MNEINFLPLGVLGRLTYYERTRRVWDFLAQNPGRAVSLEEAARIACMERTAFSRHFHQRIGMSFSELSRLYRLPNAMAIMRASDASISHVASKAGYGSISTFERHFKRAIGMSPSRYRSQVLERQKEGGQHLPTPSQLSTTTGKHMLKDSRHIPEGRAAASK